jgi:hypothetical protein
MSKPTFSPLQRFRHKYCDGCYNDACLSDKSIELRCLLAALQDATSRRIEESQKRRREKCLRR